MYNLEYEIHDNKLVISIDLDYEHGLSASGKSIMISSTSGTISLENSRLEKLMLTLYKKA